ncbi:MAG TPA: DUF4465 domain-containing protein [Kiritimatiellia bacterium]|nr:DUF4465 domain-containing protein [Kiritimatiellia bacterium]
MQNKFNMAVFGALLLAASAAHGFEASFDDPPQTVGSYWNGSDLSGGFTSQWIFFENEYDTNWSSWSGFARSRVDDTNTAGWFNQYACFGGTDVSTTGSYAIVYDSAWSEEDVVTLPLPALVSGFFVNNTTYAAISMRDGDFVSKKFGGVTGNDPDWFLLTIIGKDSAGHVVGTVEHYLADFRSPTNSEDYIQSDWRWVDLSPLGPNVKTLHFVLSSSDNGDWGMNTPSYFAMDNLGVAYAPADDYTNSTALGFETNLFVAWATGWMDYNMGGDISNNFATPAHALGPATENVTNVVTLGNGGSITLTFGVPIANGPGFDFAVFENALTENFLELAWVEVSSDGTNFVRFPNHSLTTSHVSPFGSLYATNIANLAGKYVVGQGTPFDLTDLPAGTGVDAMNVRYVRIVDIVGDGSCTDSFGNIIYDPEPTIGSGGFDLDAVGVINFAGDCQPTSIGPAGVTLRFDALSNRVYRLQYSTSLLGTDWYDVGGIVTGNNQSVSMTDSNTTGGARYYRVIREMGP